MTRAIANDDEDGKTMDADAGKVFGAGSAATTSSSSTEWTNQILNARRLDWRRVRALGKKAGAGGTWRHRAACERSVRDRVRGCGNVRSVHPLPLSMTHDEEVARRLGELERKAGETEDVFDALRRRREEKSRPGARNDGLKIGLVVEGGGMRGVISAGTLGALLEEGFYDCFDAAYGSSAGAMNLTYYLAKQPEGIRAYEEDLCDGAFLDLKRHVSRRMTVIRKAHIDLVRPLVRFGRRANEELSARNGSVTLEGATMEDIGTLAETADNQAYSTDPAMNVHYLLEKVMGGETGRPLDWRRVIESEVPLKVVATSLDTLTTVILDNFSDENDLKKCLLASARVPALAGGSPVVHRGHRLVDAAVLEPVPVHAAAYDGCTHILVLLTSPHKVDSQAETTEAETRENRRLLGRIRDRLSRLRSSRANARDVIAAARPSSSKDDSDQSAYSVSSSMDDPERAPKPAQSALYRAIRNLLFAPSYMGAIWDVYDSTAATLQARHGWRSRDIFVPSIAPTVFHPIKVATVAPSGPASKSMSSLSVDSALIAASRVEGARALFHALGEPTSDDFTPLPSSSSAADPPGFTSSSNTAR